MAKSKSVLKISTRRVIASARYANGQAAGQHYTRKQTADRLRELRKTSPGQTRKYWASKKIGQQYAVRNNIPRSWSK